MDSRERMEEVLRICISMGSTLVCHDAEELLEAKEVDMELGLGAKYRLADRCDILTRVEK